jgi:myo-inositol 2-dehydrogenase/D-chiro-inositol 1-dehydrogenase
MTVRVGVVGAGIMGADHVRILATLVPGAQLTWVCDVNIDRARSVAQSYGVPGATCNPMDVISDAATDAVLIASPDETHAPLTLECLIRGKHVLCEKPLSQKSGECLEVVAAESKRGKRLVQIGFMRRFDPAYVEMKSILDSGSIGAVVMMHNFHRNVSAPSNFTGPMAVTSSAPHDFDVARNMLRTEFSSIMVYQPKPNGTRAAAMPIMTVMRTTTGQIVTVDVNNDAQYGYDVRAELVGDDGSIWLRSPAATELNVKRTSQSGYPADWRPRFADAYRLQNIAWIASIQTGQPCGASSWDGFAASLAAECGVESLVTGREVEIKLPEMPRLYS